MTDTEIILKYLDELENNEMVDLFKICKQKGKSQNEIFNQAQRLMIIARIRTIVNIFNKGEK